MPGLLALMAVAVAGCIEGATDPTLTGVTGEWCTEATIGPGNEPVEALPYVAMTLGQQGARVAGSGAVKRAGSTALWPVGFEGTLAGDQVSLQVTAFGDDPEGPSFFLDFRIVSETRLEGTASGDPGFSGTLRMVRLGNRCFTN
jgi:hypothetical protein